MKFFFLAFALLCSLVIPIGSAGSLSDILLAASLCGFLIALFCYDGRSRFASAFIIAGALCISPVLINSFYCNSERIFMLGLALRAIVILFVIVLLSSRSNKRLSLYRRLAQACLTYLTFVGIIGLYIFLSGQSQALSTPFVGSRSFNGDPHVFGPLLSFTSVYCISLFSQACTTAQSANNLPFNKWIMLFLSLFFTVLSLISGSRGALLIYVCFISYLIFSFPFTRIIKSYRVGKLSLYLALLLTTLAGLVVVSVFSFFNNQDSLYSPQRFFLLADLLSGTDTSRSLTLATALSKLSTFYEFIIPSCNPLLIADNGLIFTMVNCGLLFAFTIFFGFFMIYRRSSSCYSKAAVLALIIFTAIASEAIFLPRFILPIAILIASSENLFLLSDS